MELTITAIRQETEDVKSFVLAPAGGGYLPYKAGQFLTFLHQAGGREFRRSYSLSGAPGLHQEMTITVKRIPNGIMSRRLIDHAMAGDTLMCTGEATGIFTLPDDLEPYEAVWLFAAGIGITPVYSILEELLHHRASHVVLIYSNRSKAETVFYDSLLYLKQQYGDRLRIVWLWSDARDLLQARLSRESFPRILKESLLSSPPRTLCYICGPASYMWLVQLLLQDAGVPAAAIRREAFEIRREVHQRLPADKASHGVTVHTPAGTGSFINAYPDPILKSARLAGLALPYSCETGQCGSCTAICTEGNVWMSYNEVLTDKDLAAGRVLTCTGHAVGGNVVLTLK